MHPPTLEGGSSYGIEMDTLKRQWCQLLKYHGEGIIDGYLIVETYIIDAAQSQDRWVRNFIATN